MNIPPYESSPYENYPREDFPLGKLPPMKSPPHLNHTNERNNKITKCFALKKAVQYNIIA